MSAYLRLLLLTALCCVGCITTLPSTRSMQSTAPSATAIRLPSLFSDNMVLQRDRPIPVWGWAEPGGLVQITLADQTARARVRRDGTWRVDLPKRPAGGPYTLTVKGRSETTFSNVLIGDVWLCSGQSNMAMTMAPGRDSVLNAEQEVAAANYPSLRLFTVPATTSFTPKHELPAAAWQVCSPETLSPFSAVGYFFGRELHRRLNVPIGLINASRGASPAEAWTSAEALHALPEYKGVIDGFDERVRSDAVAAAGYAAEEAAWEANLEAHDAGYANGNPAWADTALDDTAWPTMVLPTYWEDAGVAGFDGTMWFRRVVEIPAEWGGRDLKLGLGVINDMDRAWFDGVEVGRFEQLSGWTRPRVYPVPARLATPGKHVIAVRVRDLGGKGGFNGVASDMWFGPAKDSAGPLIGPWRYRPGIDLKDLPPHPKRPEYVNDNQRVPTVLYNGMIAPLIPYGIRGAIWYQGEGNIGRAPEYARLFPAMIQDWRTRWLQRDLPFLFVQLASFLPRETAPSDSPWAELREAQAKTLALRGTGMAVAIDIGDAENIHPRNKQEVGRRLALSALHVAYGQTLPFAGPTYRDYKVEGSAIRVRFEHADGGLAFGEGRAKGFAVAGADRRFVWADARIEGDTVVVSSSQVAVPVAVRYAWANNPDCTLVNGAGLPAVPFRTDAWPPAASSTQK